MVQMIYVVKMLVDYVAGFLWIGTPAGFVSSVYIFVSFGHQ